MMKRKTRFFGLFVVLAALVAAGVLLAQPPFLAPGEPPVIIPITSAPAAQLYLPIIKQPGPRAGSEPFYGITYSQGPGSDLRLVGATWFHNWRPYNRLPYASADWVPVLWYGRPETDLPASYAGTILVGNEPDNIRQSNIAPEEMARRFAETRAHYPNARLLCCGTLTYNDAWLKQFIAAGGDPDGWHVHAYVEGPYDVEAIIGQLSNFYQTVGGEPTWVTEYSVLDGNLDDFITLTEWMEQQMWIERISPYTNRQPHNGEWWELPPAVDLVTPQGALSGLGGWYAARAKSAQP